MRGSLWMANDGRQGGVLVKGEVDERRRDGVALLEEDVGELRHRDEVADDETGVQNDRLLHGAGLLDATALPLQ